MDLIKETKIKTLSELIEKFKKTNVLVIGDVMLDIYIEGNSVRISPEAPVPVLKVEKAKFALGGAANVAANVAALGANCYLFGTVGPDKSSKDIMKLLSTERIEYELHISKTYKTSTKFRLISDNQQIARFDMEGDTNPNETIIQQNEKLKTFLDNIPAYIDTIIISDYNKGMISPSLIEYLKCNIPNLNQTYDVAIVIDPKVENIDLLSKLDFTILTPNKKEALEYNKLKGLNPTNTAEAAQNILEETGCGEVIVTEGSNGMTVVNFLGDTYKIKSYTPKKFYNVIGAGDTMVATLGTALGTNKIELMDAAFISNIAASLVTSKPYTSVITFDELKKELSSEEIENERNSGVFRF